MLIVTDINSRHFPSTGNGKISIEFLISRNFRVMILFMSIFLLGLDK